MFGFLRRKSPQPPKDPLALYDEALESLDREGAQIRRSAATLFAARAELARSVERYRSQLRQIDERASTAEKAAKATLGRDADHARRMLASAEETLAKTEANASALEEAGRELMDRLSSLKAERATAQAQLAAGVALETAFRPTAERTRRMLALDHARDEVERAHALAEIYREERGP
jgi:chromosome segregation ATPase